MDDEDVVLMVLTRILGPAGFQIATAETVRDALEWVDANPVDVLLSDKNLPDGTGLDVVRHLRESRADCEVLMITGYGSEEAAFDAIGLGVAEFLPKPFDNIRDVRDRVRAAVERLTARRRAAEEALASPPAGPAKRLRFEVELLARFVLVDGSTSAATFVTSLSSSDLFVETETRLPVGARLTLRISLPSADVLVTGTVQRHGAGVLSTGMHVDFEADPAAQSTIDVYLAPMRGTFRESKAADAPARPDPSTDPEIDALVRRWSAPAEPPPPAAPGDAFGLFQRMQGEQARVVRFLETRSAEEQQPSGAPSGEIAPERFAAGNDAIRAEVAPPLESDLAETLKTTYGIDANLFDERRPAVVAPPVPPSKAPAPEEPAEPPPTSSAAKRRGFAIELWKRGEESLARGLLLKADADLALAVSFEPGSAELRALYERVHARAAEERAEEAFRQGLQQLALGDPQAGSALLVRACTVHYDLERIVTCARVLLQLKTPDARREAKKLLYATAQKDASALEPLLLLGQIAAAESRSAVAVRYFSRVLELDPKNQAAQKALTAAARSGGSAPAT